MEKQVLIWLILFAVLALGCKKKQDVEIRRAAMVNVRCPDKKVESESNTPASR